MDLLDQYEIAKANKTKHFHAFIKGGYKKTPISERVMRYRELCKMVAKESELREEIKARIDAF